MPAPAEAYLQGRWGGVVTIAAAAYRAFGAVTETLPDGFGCASGVLDDEGVQATNR